MTCNGARTGWYGRWTVCACQRIGWNACGLLLLLLSLLLLLLWQVEADPDERDAETRVAAVKALAAVAQHLFHPAVNPTDPTTTTPAQGQAAADSAAADSACAELAANPVAADSAADDSACADNACHESAAGGLAADPAAAALVREHVMGALLVAVEDYSTDNR